MHHIQFGLKFETKLYFFFVILCVLHVFFFESEPQRPLICSLPLHVLVAFLERCDVLFEYFFVVEALIKFIGELSLQLLDFLLVLVADLCYHHFVIRDTAVFQENGKDLPYASDQGVFLI